MSFTVFDEFYFRGEICNEGFELYSNARYSCKPVARTCDLHFSYSHAYPNVTLLIYKKNEKTNEWNIYDRARDATVITPYRDHTNTNYFDERGGLYQDSMTFGL